MRVDWKKAADAVGGVAGGVSRATGELAEALLRAMQALPSVVVALLLGCCIVVSAGVWLIIERLSDTHRFGKDPSVLIGMVGALGQIGLALVGLVAIGMVCLVVLALRQAGFGKITVSGAGASVDVSVSSPSDASGEEA